MRFIRVTASVLCMLLACGFTFLMFEYIHGRIGMTPWVAIPVIMIAIYAPFAMYEQAIKELEANYDYRKVLYEKVTEGYRAQLKLNSKALVNHVPHDIGNCNEAWCKTCDQLTDNYGDSTPNSAITKCGLDPFTTPFHIIPRCDLAEITHIDGNDDEAYVIVDHKQ